METINIQINHTDALETDSDGKLGIKVSNKTGNTLQIRNNGLYAEAIPGQPGIIGSGFPDGYRSNEVGIISGVESPYSSTVVPHRIVAPSIVHRVFTCQSADGSDISAEFGFRTVDRLYPGDLYRVHDNSNNAWNYYIITKTDGSNVTGHSGIVATIPDSYLNVN